MRFTTLQYEESTRDALQHWSPVAFAWGAWRQRRSLENSWLWGSEQIPGASCTNDSGPALTVALQNVGINIYFLYIADLVPLWNYGKAVPIISSDMIFWHRGNPQNPHTILPAVQIQHNSEKPSRPRSKFHRLLTYSKTCRFEYWYAFQIFSH